MDSICLAHTSGPPCSRSRPGPYPRGSHLAAIREYGLMLPGANHNRKRGDIQDGSPVCPAMACALNIVILFVFSLFELNVIFDHLLHLGAIGLQFVEKCCACTG